MAETSSELDRISELPDHVKHRILSLLTSREAIDTSLLSRAWKDEWLRLPCLDLGEKFFNRFLSAYEFSGYREKGNPLFMDYVDRILAKRTLTLKHGNWFSLRKLCLYMPFYDGTRYSWRFSWPSRLLLDEMPEEITPRLDRWLDYAVGCLKIKELSVDNNSKYSYELPEHIMKDAYSLTSLSLRCVQLDQDIIDTIASHCALLEFLCFQRCTSECSLVRLSGFNKLIEVDVRSFFSSRFEIDSATLETFSYRNYGSKLICEINVASCSGLKHLKIHGATLTDDSLSCHLAHLSNLQELVLEDCKSLTCVKILNRGLKHLSLRNTKNKLVGVEIDAVNLKKFTYSQGNIRPSPFFTLKDFNSRKTVVDIGNNRIQMLWNDEVTKFMGQLDQCSRYLEKRVVVGATTMRYLKEQKFPPLYYVKQLTIETRGVHRYPALVRGVLSLFPRLEMLLFRSVPFAPEMTAFMLKMKYKGGADDKENYRGPWWHQLLEVTIENIEGAEECLAPLKALFKKKRATEKIVVHVVDKDKSQ